MKKFAALSVLLLATSLTAQAFDSKEFEIGSIEVTETTLGHKSFKSLNNDPDPKPPVDRLECAGKVISTSKDIVALGESVYELVKKGKPTNTTDYAAISVVPKDPTTKEVVSPFDLEGFSMPVIRSFTTNIKNWRGKEVITFDYQIIYSFGGSYDGKGKYLTGVMIIPKQIRTSWGWDFNAKMSLSSIMNHGSKENPIAGALVTVKYQMNSMGSATERNHTIHVTGAGEVKSYGLQ